MAVEYTPRFGVAYWDSDNDDFSRSQLTLSHNRIEERGAIFRQDVFGQRGAATTWTRSFFYDETNEVLYFSDGTNWLKLTDFGSTVSIVAVSPTTPTADQGTSDQAARIDHRHATPPWGTSIQSTHTSNTSGSTAEFARVDHRHAIGAGSVGAGALAVNAISNSNMFTNRVVNSSAIGLTAVTKENIATDQQIPAGVIMAYVGATAPTGWLLCNGQSVLKSAFPDLWTVLSSQNYGSTTTEFNVPDLLDRMPRGAATTGTTLGTKAGSDAVTIAAANLPNHTHSVGTLAVGDHPSHTHLLNGTGASAVANTDADHRHYVASPGASGSFSQTSGGGFPYSVLGFTGGNDAYQLMPPYWGGRPSDAGVATTVPISVGSVSVTVNAHYTNYSDGSDISHGHTLTGSSQGPSATLTHSVSGATGNPVGTVGTDLTVTPKTQTVNYIIKT